LEKNQLVWQLYLESDLFSASLAEAGAWQLNFQFVMID
jgi:hypothetical protein